VPAHYANASAGAPPEKLVPCTLLNIAGKILTFSKFLLDVPQRELTIGEIAL